MTSGGPEHISVLIVDDHAETRENIRKLLQFESDIDVVGAARNAEEALQIARESQPDVVLMDINLPDMDGITATEALLRDVPSAQIVMLSVQSDLDYVRRAMVAGARDFIPKPPSGDELISRIRLVSVRSKEEKRRRAEEVKKPVDRGPEHFGPSRPEGKLIVVYSAKGGVGCTTLATNLAIGLTTMETPTVLADANLQFGDVSVFLNLQPKNSFVDLASRSEDLDADIIEEVLMQHASGLRVLAAPPRPEMADEITVEQVKKVLQHLKHNFAYVLVDTSSSMSDVTLGVLDLADMLIAIATPDIPSIKDARLLFDLLQILGFPKERVFFVLNKMDKRTGITAEAVAENLKRPVEGEIPAVEQTVTTSINKGVPLLMGDKSRPPAKSILDLLGAVKHRLVAEAAEIAEGREPERARLFGRA